MLRESKHRAKKRGIEFYLDLEDMQAKWREQDGRCAISGMPLTYYRRGTGSPSLSNASIDRLNPVGPYTIDNTHLVCSGVNLMRRHLELDEFIVWCRQIADHHRSTWDEPDAIGD